MEPKTQLSQSVMTFEDFVQTSFVPDYVAMMTVRGRTHYQAMLKHILRPDTVNRIFHADSKRTKLEALPNWPYLDHVRLHEAQPSDIQKLIWAALAHGYSTQTVVHIRNVVSAIFGHAKRESCFLGDNPASLVTIPQITHKEAYSLTLAQVIEAFAIMHYPEKEIALFALFTNMSVAEALGLQWRRVNLTDLWCNADGELIPPRSIAVRQEWCHGTLDPVKGRGRPRDLQIPAPLLSSLLPLSQRERFTAPDDFVLVSRRGTPLNLKSVVARRLKPIGARLRIPSLSWLVWRRTQKILCSELGLQAAATELSISLHECAPLTGKSSHYYYG